MTKATDFADLVRKTRSIRRFYENRPLTENGLKELVDLARLSPNAGNKQTLRFHVVSGAAACAEVFPTLAWAGYLRDWAGPQPGERPTGYIVILTDKRPGADFPADLGIAAQSILLGATAHGWGGCFIGCVQREELAKRLHFTDNPVYTDYAIGLVIALGVPKEEVFIEAVPPGGDIKYYRDAQGGHHVPKRALQEIII